jgi:hypothetical protein
MIDLPAFLTIATLLFRTASIIKLDGLREGKRNRAFKLLFGAYAIEAMLPILRTGRTRDERYWTKVSNVLLVLFYVFFAATMVTILALYA